MLPPTREMDKARISGVIGLPSKLKRIAHTTGNTEKGWAPKAEIEDATMESQTIAQSLSRLLLLNVWDIYDAINSQLDKRAKDARLQKTSNHFSSPKDSLV